MFKFLPIKVSLTGRFKFFNNLKFKSKNTAFFLFCIIVFTSVSCRLNDKQSENSQAEDKLNDNVSNSSSFDTSLFKEPIRLNDRTSNANGEARVVQISPDRSKLAVSGIRNDLNHGFIIVYDLPSMKILHREELPSYTDNIVFSDDSSRMAAKVINEPPAKALVIWETVNWRKIVTGFNEAPSGLTFGLTPGTENIPTIYMLGDTGILYKWNYLNSQKIEKITNTPLVVNPREGITSFSLTSIKNEDKSVTIVASSPSGRSPMVQMSLIEGLTAVRQDQIKNDSQRDTYANITVENSVETKFPTEALYVTSAEYTDFIIYKDKPSLLIVGGLNAGIYDSEGKSVSNFPNPLFYKGITDEDITQAYYGKARLATEYAANGDISPNGKMAVIIRNGLADFYVKTGEKINDAKGKQSDWKGVQLLGSVTQLTRIPIKLNFTADNNYLVGLVKYYDNGIPQAGDVVSINLKTGVVKYYVYDNEVVAPPPVTANPEKPTVKPVINVAPSK